MIKKPRSRTKKGLEYLKRQKKLRDERSAEISALAGRIIKIKSDRKLTMKELSLEVGISEATLSRIVGRYPLIPNNRSTLILLQQFIARHRVIRKKIETYRLPAA